MTHTQTHAPAALDEKLLAHAFDGISWRPESHIAATRREFASYIEKYRQASAPLPDAAERQAAFESGLAKHFNAWLAKMSSCLSCWITGPARFNVRRAEARNKSEHEARQALNAWIEKQFKRLRLDTDSAAGRGPIRSDAPNAPEQLQKKIDLETQTHALEVAYNKAARKGKEARDKWLSDILPQAPADIRALFMRLYEKYDCQKYGTFPAYHLQLENANIKRLRERLADIEKKRAAASEAADVETPDGVRIERDGTANRLRIYYPDKPDSDTRARLKAAGFRWAPSVGAWQNYLNRSAERFIETEFA